MKFKKLIINSTAIILLFGVMVSFATVFTNTIDTATPVGTDAPSVIDNRIRESKAGWQERLNVEHVFDLTGTQVSAADTGEHTAINCTSVTSSGAISGTTITGTTISGTNLTASGTLDVTGNIDPTTCETTNGGFLDEDAMGSDAADKVASQQSIKAYIDAQIAANAVNASALCKGWAHVAANGTLLAGFNATSARTATGKYTITWGTDFASANYSIVTSCDRSGSVFAQASPVTRAAGTVTIEVGEQGTGFTDRIWSIAAFGAQ